MGGILQTAPSQPLYVWPIHTSAIVSTGYVRGNHRFGAVGLHGHVIYGVQSIMVMAPSMKSQMPEKIFVYGYPLYTWYGRTPYGGSRFRIPFIVWVWNYIVSGVNVTAKVGGTTNMVDVCATAGSAVSTLNLTHFDTVQIDSQRDGYIAYTTDKIHRAMYAMFASTPQLDIHQIGIHVNVLGRIRRLFGLLVSTRDAQMERHVKLVANFNPNSWTRMVKLNAFLHHPLNQVAKTHVALHSPYLDRTLKTHIALRSPDLNRVLKTQINLRLPYLERTVKTHVALRSPYLERTVKTHINLRSSYLDRTVKTQVSLQTSYLERSFKMFVRPQPSDLVRTFKVSVRPIPCEIEPVWAFIKTNLSSYFHSNTTNVSTTLLHYAQRSIGVHTQLEGLGERTQNITLSTLRSQQHNTVTTHMGLYPESQHMLVASLLEQPTQRTKVLLTTIRTEQKIGVKFNTLVLQERWYRAEIDVLPLLAERNIKFFPSTAPFVEQIGIMVSICRTHLLAYLEFVPDEFQKDLDLIVSTCPYTTSTIMEWYLHGGRITNEGGNEIIFDLGEVDPVGPIPPVPSRTWEGGYVEDPFRGLSYNPGSDSTGFGSPSAAQWVSNTQMWWSSTSDPWVQPSS